MLSFGSALEVVWCIWEDVVRLFENMTSFYIKFLSIQEIWCVQRRPWGGNSGWILGNGLIQIHLFWSHHYHGLVLARDTDAFAWVYKLWCQNLEILFLIIQILSRCINVLHVIKINRNREADVSALRKSPLTQFFLSGRELSSWGSLVALLLCPKVNIIGKFLWSSLPANLE